MKKLIEEKLKEVIDPEIGFDVISLGLIYNIEVKNKKAKITMTLTSPFCPYGSMLIEMVKRKVEELGLEVEIELTFNPPWSIEKASKNVRKKLGLI